jgi:hypothetical protein
LFEDHDAGYKELIKKLSSSNDEVVNLTKCVTDSLFHRYVFYDDKGIDKIAFVLPADILNKRREKARYIYTRFSNLQKNSSSELDSKAVGSLNHVTGYLSAVRRRLDNLPDYLGLVEIKDKDGKVIGYEKVFDLSDQESINDFYRKIMIMEAEIINPLEELNFGAEETKKFKNWSESPSEHPGFIEFFNKNWKDRETWSKLFERVSNSIDKLMSNEEKIKAFKELRQDLFNSIGYILFGEDLLPNVNQHAKSQSTK